MRKRPSTLRIFKKPDHVSFLGGYVLILAALPNASSFELKLASMTFFTFTLTYEILEISEGNRQLIKLDHMTFIIAYALLIATFWGNSQTLLVISSVLFGFTLGFEIYSVRKKDIETYQKKR
ncbi:MAG: hypothetical protein ACE5KO_06750 [Candidatus Bathyarchaeia archaeon]